MPQQLGMIAQCVLRHEVLPSKLPGLRGHLSGILFIGIQPGQPVFEIVKVSVDRDVVDPGLQLVVKVLEVR